MRFVYSVIRYVPNPARGEFVNVGVIVGSDETDKWEVRGLDNMSASADRFVGDGSTVSAVAEFVEDLGLLFAEHSELGHPLMEGPPPVPSEAWLDQIHATHRNIVQLSTPYPMAADSISDAVSEMFEMLVAVDGSNQG